jgi:hypothetical protein
MHRVLIACGLAALAACHDLPALGSCGNGIVEAARGEACDDGRDSATCTATCELKCLSSAGDAAYVPVGTDASKNPVYCPDASYQCGHDAVCRAPSGRFAPLEASSLAFDVSAPPVTGDVDNDGVTDLIGTSETSIFVRFGSGSAPLGEVVVQEAPFADAPYAIFDLPANRADKAQPGTMIAIPTEGIALLRSDGERFTPQLDLPFKNLGGLIGGLGAVDSIQGVVVRDPDPALGEVVIAVQSRSMTAGILVARVPVGQPAIPAQLLPPCVGSGSQAWRTVDVKAAPDRQSFVVVTQRDDPAQPAAQPWHVCRYTHPGATWVLADFELAPPAPSSIVLANVDGEPCLELVVQVSGMHDLGVVDASGAGCGFTPAVTPLAFADPSTTLLAAGQLVPGGPDELVLANGVYRACAGAADCGVAAAGTYVRVAGPTPPSVWTSAAVVDLNGDGVLDAVAGRGHQDEGDAVPAREPDVDVVRGGAVPNVYRANTSEPVTSLVAGDFDGDRLGDVAMIEASPPGDRVTVLFGTREATAGTPIAMSAFGGRLRIDRVSEIHWLPSARGSDGIDDLLVIDTGATPAAGVLVGDAARLMTTPRFPTSSAAGGRPLGAVAAGAFGSDDLEILALDGHQAQLYNVMANSWASPPVNLGIQLDQPVGALRAGASQARAAARGTGADAGNVVVFSMRGAVTTCTVTPSGAPHELRGIDIDGDGGDELAVFSDDSKGRRTLQLFRAAGCPLEPVLVDELASCVDVVSAGQSLVAICREPDADTNASGVVDPAARALVSITNVGGQPVITPSAKIDGDARFVTAGDFDGDGVLDVAVGVHRGSGVGVQLLRQCPAHDTRACP